MNNRNVTGIHTLGFQIRINRHFFVGTATKIHRGLKSFSLADLLCVITLCRPILIIHHLWLLKCVEHVRRKISGYTTGCMFTNAPILSRWLAPLITFFVPVICHNFLTQIIISNSWPVFMLQSWNYGACSTVSFILMKWLGLKIKILLNFNNDCFGCKHANTFSLVTQQDLLYLPYL